MTLTLTQGATETITAKNLLDAAGTPLDPTGWGIHAVIRQYGTEGPVVATWRDDPGEGEGFAEVVDSTDPDDAEGTKWVVLHVAPAVSAGWSWSFGVCQCEITEPDGDERVARIIDDTVYLNPEAVTDEE